MLGLGLGLYHQDRMASMALMMPSMSKIDECMCSSRILGYSQFKLDGLLCRLTVLAILYST